MVKRNYKSTALDMHRIADGLATHYAAEHFDVQHLVDGNQGMVQIKKEGFMRTVLGLGKALGVRMAQSDEGLFVTVGIQDALSKLVVGDLVSPVTAIIGAVGEVHMGHKIMDEIDALVRQQDSAVQFE